MQPIKGLRRIGRTPAVFFSNAGPVDDRQTIVSGSGGDGLPTLDENANAAEKMGRPARSATGVVTLLGTRASDGASKHGGAGCRPGLRLGGLAGGAGDLLPDDETDGHYGAVLGGGHHVTAGSEVR
ncbi:hypothetical protein [Streptomyces sp. Tue6028]|uniref:hypothetical protein n=1 Tax=Streptomyces sp. Tue6028 TaxID=2036037 RepID=UPI003D74DC41